MQQGRIVIIGGGPVGLALAVGLGMRGIDCVLVEPRMSMHRIPKGQNLTQRTLEHFYFWGIVDELRRARVMPPNAPIGEITAYGDLASDYWHAPRGRELVRPYYFQDNDRMPQYRMEEVLRAKLATLPSVEARFGWQATAIAQDDGGVRVTIANEATGETTTLAADYAVGCDGGGSVVREAEPVVTLVPVDVPLEAEVSVNSRDIGQVAAGDVARVKFDAYPFQKFGTADGSIRTVSRDAFTPDGKADAQGAAAMPYFKARVLIDDKSLDTREGPMHLLPGMTVTAEIKVGTRTIISYFLYPLLRGLDDSIREP